MMGMAKRLAGCVVVALLSGCAGYTQQTAEMTASVRAGDVDAALKSLEQKNSSSDKDLLYFLEKGELLRMKGAYDSSLSTWMTADAVVRIWENTAKNDPAQLLGDLGSVVVNDTTRRYDGRDYEKVMLSVRLALDHIALGHWDLARVEIKKMHEREAIIADFRAKELDAAKAKAQQDGLKTTSFKDLGGYPVQTLDAPEVRALKNAYESAIANYLAGFVYETLGEPSLAAPGYRKAAEMRPGSDLVDDGLKGLDRRMSAASGASGMVDTLLVIETGHAPEFNSVQLPIFLPIPGRFGISLVATPLSWPVVAVSPPQNPAAVGIDDHPVPVVLMTDINLMARKALADEMPGIIARSSVRAITRGAAQAAMETATQASNNSAVQMFGMLASLATKVAAVATEQADERTWRTLPAGYSIARLPLVPGRHRVSIGATTQEFEVGGRTALVALRLSGNQLYVAPRPADAVSQPAPAAVPAPPPPPAVAPAAPAASLDAAPPPPPPSAAKKKRRVKQDGDATLSPQ